MGTVEVSPGATFAGYRILSELGRGGMSVVYLAEHLGLSRKVALKLLAPHLASDQRFRERFVRESRLAASIDHPNVIPIYEAGEEDGRLFIAMRYVDGTDLKALLADSGTLRPPRAVSIVRQAAAALDAAHSRGLVHRDVKPANMLIAGAGSGSQAGDHVYLSDFGLTRRAASDSGLTGSGQFVGTLDYAAPEQFQSRRLDARTDTYSLGCVLFECLAGRPPFRRESDAAVMYAHLVDPPPSLAEERGDLPEGIDAVVARAMAKQPEERFQSAGDLAQAAASALGVHTGEHAARARTPTPRRRVPRRALVAGIAAALVVAVLAALLPKVIGGGTKSPGGSRATAASTPAGMAIISAKDGHQVAFVTRSQVHTPAEAIYADGHFWVLNLDPLSFAEIEPRTGRIVKQIASPFDVGYYAVDGDTLWVTATAKPVVAKMSISLGREVARYTVATSPSDHQGTLGIAVGAGSVWVGRWGGGPVTRLDADTGKIQHVYDDASGHFSVAFGDGAVWAAGDPGIVRIDPSTNQVSTVALPQGHVGNYVAAGGGFGWTEDETKGVVYKVDATGHLVDTYHTGDGARVLSFSDSVLWVANQDAGTVTGIDAVTGKLTTYRFDHPLQAVAAGSGLVLVQLNLGRTYEDRIDALRGTVVRLLVQPYQLESDDPAQLWNPLGFEVEYATCANLLRYPDVAGPDGATLQPEVAASMPTVSADGRTYTFRVRSGYQFSPPSNQPLTAETFRYSIERALSPKLGDGTPGPTFVDDIEGEAAFRDEKAEHISGLQAEGDQLTITLVKPSPDFLGRLSLPFFCPVPSGTPVVPNGDVLNIGTGDAGNATVPSAGPYYIADAFNGEYAILKRNPNYTGPRPHALDAIALREGIDPGQAVQRVQSGGWDGLANPFDPLLQPGGPLDQQWGPDSNAASQGDQRWFGIPLSGIDVLAFNAGRQPFSDPDVRRAAAVALDRSALAAAFQESPTSGLLPPVQTGRAGPEPFHVDRPDVEKARALLEGRHLTVTLANQAGCDQCTTWAKLVQEELGAVGITVRIEDVDVETAVHAPNSRFDLYNPFWIQDYADPASMLTSLLGEVPTPWLPKRVDAEVQRLATLEGRARTDAAVSLATRLAGTDLPVTGFAFPETGQFFSPHLGCRVFPPFGYGVDLVALCRNG